MMPARTRRTPPGARRAPRAVGAALLVLWGLAAWAPGASAQYFGVNKVQYKNFKWKVLRTEHFDIYHYEGEEAAVQDAALMAERGYQRLSRVLEHQIRSRIPLVLYASHTDFEQTNIIPEILSTGTGGVTEYLKRRVFLPFTGSFADLDHVLTHELVHAFQVDILFGERQGLIGNPFASTPPLWFMEGMAEYLSIGAVDNNTKMWLRDASLEGYLIPIRTLAFVGDVRVYRFGQSIMQFIADTYGIQKIGELLKRTRRAGSLDKALEQTTGLTVDVLSKKWSESVRKEHLPQIAEFEKPEALAARLTDAERDLSNFNVAPSVSPSGTQMVFISDRSMYNDLYLASALDGKVFKKLVAGERTGSFETLRFFNTSIAWSPDEKRIAVPAKIGGEDAIYLIQVPSGKVDRKLKFGLDAIYSPAWSPDGSKLAFVGIKGGLSKLYMADVDGKNLRELRGGRYAVRDPAWSPDGATIAYATDEGPATQVDRLVFGPLQIALYRIDTGETTVLPGQRGMNISPQWSPDGRSILYVSDRTGIANLYRIDLASGSSDRLTNLLTGISGIIPESPCVSLSRDGKRLVFSAFTRGGWDLYGVRDVAKLLERKPAPSGPLAGAGGAPEMQAELGASDAGPDATPASEPSASAAPRDSAAAGIDTTLALYVRQVYREPLTDSTTFVRLPYRARFSRDFVSGGAIFASNVGFAGSTIMSFSDVLGNHNIVAALNLFGDLANSDLYLAYTNLSRRTNYGVAVFQFRDDLLLSSSPGRDEVETQIYRGAALSLSRPFSRFRRLEYGVEAAAIDGRVLELNYDLATISEIDDQGTYYYVAPSMGLVGDNALYGSTGPINGGRSRLSVEQALGDVQYTSLLLDWRRYSNIRHRYSVAQRLIAGTRFGRDPRFFRFGGAFTFRGVDYGDLIGTNALLGNLEFRFPLIEQLRFGWPSRISLGGINGALFLDAASAWSEGERPRFFTTSGGFRADDLLLAYGAGARVNLGYFILRYDYGQGTNLRESVGKAQHFVAFGAEF